MTEIIDGNEIADRIRAELEMCVETLADHGVTPGLATVLMNDDSASETYDATVRDEPLFDSGRDKIIR